jgi:AcrR family transcriptional regulator
MGTASQTRPKAPKRRAYRMVARAEATAATRSRLLEAAWRQFSEHPFEHARLADVARDAQVSLPTLHSHFGTKDKLFVAAWRWRMTPESARRDATPPGDVDAAVRTLYSSYEQDGDAVLRLFTQEDRIPAVHEMLDDGRRRHRAWVERTLGELVEGSTGAERERRLVSLVVATDLLVWKLLRREMGLGRETAERIVTEMVTRVREAP